jgi:hypothetical protein
MSEITYDYSELQRQYRPQGSVLATTAFLAMVACIINTALPEMEILLTGGRCPIPIAAIKVAGFGLLTILTLAYGRLDLSAFPTGMWVVAMTFLFLDFPYLWLSQAKQPADLIFDYNAYYCPLIFAPLACAFTGRLPEKSVTRILVSIFLICGVIGWAQVIFQAKVVPLVSSDGNFRIFASWWSPEGGGRTMRAFSMFGSSLEYGSFVTLFAGIGIGMCGRPKGWIKGVPLYLFAAACCYSTLTRTVFLLFVFVTIAAVIFTFGRSPRRMTWQPLIGLVVALVIAFGGIGQKVSQARTLTDTGSLDLRVLQWETYGEQLLRSTLPQQLFGLGFCQAEKPLIIPVDDVTIGNAYSILVDNMYLALTLHIGLVGMVIIVGLFWAMWRRLRVETISRPTPLLIGIASLCSTFLLDNMFNISPAIYGFWFLIAIMILQRDDAEEDVVSLSARQPHPALAP